MNNHQSITKNIFAWNGGARESEAKQGNCIHARGARESRFARAVARFGRGHRQAGRAGTSSSGTEAERFGTLHLSERAVRSERDALLQGRDVRIPCGSCLSYTTRPLRKHA